MNTELKQCIEFLKEVEYIKNDKDLNNFLNTVKEYHTFSLEFDIMPDEKINAYIFIFAKGCGTLEIFGKCNLDKACKYEYLYGYDMQSGAGTIASFHDCLI